MRARARKREKSEENFPRDRNISVARVRATEEKRKEEKRIREKKGRKGREGVAEEILRLRKRLEMGGEERRQGRERKEGGNREARPPCDRLVTKAISVARRREEGEREVEEEEILLLPLTRARVPGEE